MLIIVPMHCIYRIELDSNVVTDVNKERWFERDIFINVHQAVGMEICDSLNVLCMPFCHLSVYLEFL